MFSLKVKVFSDVKSTEIFPTNIQIGFLKIFLTDILIKFTTNAETAGCPISIIQLKITHARHSHFFLHEHIVLVLMKRAKSIVAHSIALYLLINDHVI